MNTNGLEYIEVEECTEKSNLILFNSTVRVNSAMVRCISDDDLKDKCGIVHLLSIVRRGKRLFVKKSDIVGFIDADSVQKKEQMSKRLRGSVMNYSSAPDVEYLDSKARSMRRS